jgi:hypothetical protein
MDEQIVDRDQADEAILSHIVSDEALEAAAGTEKELLYTNGSWNWC